MNGLELFYHFHGEFAGNFEFFNLANTNDSLLKVCCVFD